MTVAPWRDESLSRLIGSLHLWPRPCPSLMFSSFFSSVEIFTQLLNTEHDQLHVLR